MAPPTPIDRVKAAAEAAYNAGFRGRDLATIVAIALEESGANPDATNNTARPGVSGYREPGSNASPEYSVGPWQINLEVHELAESAARDFNAAAKYAYNLVYGTPQGFNHWSVYRNVRAVNLLEATLVDLAILPADAFIDNPERPSRSDSFVTEAGETVPLGNPPANSTWPFLGGDLDVPGYELPTPPLLDSLRDILAWIADGKNITKVALTAGGVVLILVGVGIYVFGPTVATRNPAVAAATNAVESVAE